MSPCTFEAILALNRASPSVLLDDLVIGEHIEIFSE
jgi:hypothetical protein